MFLIQIVCHAGAANLRDSSAACVSDLKNQTAKYNTLTVNNQTGLTTGGGLHHVDSPQVMEYPGIPELEGGQKSYVRRIYICPSHPKVL